MGHVKNADGSLVINPTPKTVEDLQAIADLAVGVGGLVKVTSAQRGALTPAATRVGWLIVETDTGSIYQRTATHPQGQLVHQPDTGWVNVPTFNNGFRSSTTQPVRYRRIGRVTYLAGGLLRDNIPGGVIAFGIPAGFRPGSQVRLRGREDLGMNVIIEANGAVTVQATVAQPGTAGEGYTLNGISFPADN